MNNTLHNMLIVSQNTPLDKINEGLLNAWNESLKIAAKQGDETAIRIWRKNHGNKNKNRRFR